MKIKPDLTKATATNMVLRDCGLSAKFKFIFRKKFSSNIKFSVTKSATSQSPKRCVLY